MPTEFGAEVHRTIAKKVHGVIEREVKTKPKNKAGPGNGGMGWKRIVNGAVQLVALQGCWDLDAVDVRDHTGSDLGQVSSATVFD